MKNALFEPRFETRVCDELFEEVLGHDLIDLEAELPGLIHLDYSQEQITQAYRLSRQLWKDGVAHQLAFLRRYATKVFWFREISQEDQVACKDIRAKMKNLRCACALFDARHCYPKYFNRITIIMGRLQDRIKNDLNHKRRRFARRLRFHLATLPYYRICQEIDSFQPSTPEEFQAYMNGQIGLIREALAQEKMTKKEFHELRKVISRQVAFYDNMKVLDPSPYHHDLTRYLGTILTLMGNVHDEIVEQNLQDSRDHYADLIELPSGIRTRLADFATSRA